MRILLASSSSGSRGGGELYLLYLGRALAQRGHTVLLWASDHPRMDELANSFSGIGEVLRSPYRNTYDLRGRSISSYLNLRSVGQLAREWKKANPEILHVNKQNLEDGLDLLHAARRSHLPNICTIHLTQSAGYLKAKMAPARDFIARRALQNYHNSLVTVLENRRQDLTAFIGESPRIRMIPNGVPLYDIARRPIVREAKRADLGIANDELLVIAVGRMVAQKRPLEFLARAEEVLRHYPKAKFLWVGDGTLSAAWDEWVEAHQLGKTIRRLPWRNDVPSLLMAADVFLHVAEYEGLPLAILEAMSAALPCAIASHLLAEMPFLDATNSLSVADDGAWMDMLQDHGRLHAIGAASRNLVEEKYSYAKMAEAYEALYHEALGKP
ncbi:MAG: glycosyltransferase family 4 protein [Chthoniobacter sp.]|uniref:glycosyltransferase family 4 protein n=1 Tax=Chthoniobacter sp. TaxID=2510640 RepID=UPI0032A7F7D7